MPCCCIVSSCPVSIIASGNLFHRGADFCLASVADVFRSSALVRLCLYFGHLPLGTLSSVLCLADIISIPLYRREAAQKAYLQDCVTRAKCLSALRMNARQLQMLRNVDIVLSNVSGQRAFSAWGGVVRRANTRLRAKFLWKMGAKFFCAFEIRSCGACLRAWHKRVLWRTFRARAGQRPVMDQSLMASCVRVWKLQVARSRVRLQADGMYYQWNLSHVLRVALHALSDLVLGRKGTLLRVLRIRKSRIVLHFGTVRQFALCRYARACEPAHTS